MKPFSTTTSGDLLADRRYDYGDAALAEGDFPAARDLFEQTLERVPGWPPAHVALARACFALGCVEDARAALDKAMALDPEDRLGAGVLLGQIEGKAGAGAMPDAFVAALFDEYAPRFDGHLVEALAYRAPQMLAALLARHPAPPAGTVLDLGCGTGLMAAAMPPGSLWYGVDLSAAMLAEAARTARYASLERAELAGWLCARPAASADLVIAADVFCYVPDLAPVFAQAARVLRPGGRLAFTVQTHEGEGAIVGRDMRIHHAPALIRTLGERSGFTLVERENAATRKDRGVPVPGALFLFVR